MANFIAQLVYVFLLRCLVNFDAFVVGLEHTTIGSFAVYIMGECRTLTFHIPIGILNLVHLAVLAFHRKLNSFEFNPFGAFVAIKLYCQ